MADDIGTGLALSGGGYRAMLFSLGSLWRLNEMGWLSKLDMITSMSGGSILNGVLAMRWKQLQWENRPVGRVATNFATAVAAPVQDLASRTLEFAAGLEGLLSLFGTISDKIVEAYDQYLFHGTTLQDLPAFETGKNPRFLFYATSLQTGSSVRMEQKRLADYKVGEIPNPTLSLAHDNDVTGALALIRTRLNEFSPKEQSQLINWGYALTDAAMRAWVDPHAARAITCPLAEFAL